MASVAASPDGTGPDRRCAAAVAAALAAAGAAGRVAAGAAEAGGWGLQVPEGEGLAVMTWARAGNSSASSSSEVQGVATSAALGPLPAGGGKAAQPACFEVAKLPLHSRASLQANPKQTCPPPSSAAPGRSEPSLSCRGVGGGTPVSVPPPPSPPLAPLPAPAAAALGGVGGLPRGGVRYLHESSRLSAAFQELARGTWRAAEGGAGGEGSRPAAHAEVMGPSGHVGHQPRLAAAVRRAGRASPGGAPTKAGAPGGCPVSSESQDKDISPGPVVCGKGQQAREGHDR